MSTTALSFEFYVDGSLADADAVKLSDPTGTYGVKRTDTDAAVVADGTAMTRTDTGTYTYSITDPTTGLTYAYYAEVEYGGEYFYFYREVAGTVTPSTSSGTDLQAARYRFILSSNRYDLVASGDLDSNVDDGANYYINRAQRYLDEFLDLPKQIRRKLTTLTSGDYYLDVENLIYVKRLFLVNADGVTDLSDNQLSESELREYAEDDPTQWTNSEPEYWCLAAAYPSPDDEDKVTSDYSTLSALYYTTLDLDESWNKRRIVFYPPADGTYTVDLLGKFYSATLSSNSDTSIWTREHPDLLDLAANYVHAMSLGSDSQSRNYERMLAVQLNRLDDQVVQDEELYFQRSRRYLNVSKA